MAVRGDMSVVLVSLALCACGSSALRGGDAGAQLPADGVDDGGMHDADEPQDTGPGGASDGSADADATMTGEDAATADGGSASRDDADAASSDADAMADAACNARGTLFAEATLDGVDHRFALGCSQLGAPYPAADFTGASGDDGFPEFIMVACDDAEGRLGVALFVPLLVDDPIAAAISVAVAGDSRSGTGTLTITHYDLDDPVIEGSFALPDSGVTGSFRGCRQPLELTNYGYIRDFRELFGI